MQALVVDDSYVQRKVAAILMRQLGWAVTEAATAHEAAVVCRQQNVDLVLTDLSLRGASGAALARWLRRRQTVGQTLGQTGRLTRVIGMTATNPQVGLPDARRIGLERLLVKPFDSATLAAALEGSGASASRKEATALIDSDRIAAMTADLGEAGARHLIARFIADGARLVASGLAADRHHLAGAAAIFGATALQAALAEGGSTDNTAVLALWEQTCAAFTTRLTGKS
jgi:CheY-like chemotaxis protein